jgi:opacity protein-like surface antigen
MKIKLLVAAAATVMASSAMAQSAFQGFYGQIATGYENNNVSNLTLTGTDTTDNSVDSWGAGNQSFGGAPLVIGLGYNFSVAPKWLIGIGADYSALSQKSSSYSQTISGNNGSSASLNGSTIEMSNRFNIFVTPGYAIDKDKLAYFKAGYSMVTAKANSPSGYTDSDGSSLALGSGSQSKNLSGFIVGAGYKQIITGGLYGFAEFNYMSYGKQTFSGTLDQNYNVSISPSVSSYQALVGVGYRF